MDGYVKVVHHDLNDLALLYYEWIDHAIYQGVGVGGSGADSREEGGNFLCNVCDVVEVRP